MHDVASAICEAIVSGNGGFEFNDVRESQCSSSSSAVEDAGRLCSRAGCTTEHGLLECLRDSIDDVALDERVDVLRALFEQLVAQVNIAAQALWRHSNRGECRSAVGRFVVFAFPLCGSSAELRQL